MNVASLAFSIVTAAMVLSTSGCGPAGDGITIKQTSPPHVDLLERADPNTTPSLKAILQRGTVLYEGSALAQDTVRVAEIDTLCQELETRLAETNLFVSVEYAGAFDILMQLEPDEVLLVLSCQEEYSYNRAANATKAGLTGLFTLGLAPTKLEHGYESRMTIKATKSAGQAKEYESFTGSCQVG